MKELERVRKQWSSSNLSFYRLVFLYVSLRRSSREANFPRILEPEVLLSCWQTPSHWSLSWVTWIQPPQYSLITLRSIVVLFSHLCIFIASGHFPAYFPTKPIWFSLLLHACHILHPSSPPWCDCLNNIYILHAYIKFKPIPSLEDSQQETPGRCPLL